MGGVTLNATILVFMTNENEKDDVVTKGGKDGDITYVDNVNDQNTGILYFDLFKLIVDITFDIPFLYGCSHEMDLLLFWISTVSGPTKRFQ